LYFIFSLSLCNFNLMPLLCFYKPFYCPNTPHGLVLFVKQPMNLVNAWKTNAQHVLRFLVWSCFVITKTSSLLFTKSTGKHHHISFIFNTYFLLKSGVNGYTCFNIFTNWPLHLYFTLIFNKIGVKSIILLFFLHLWIIDKST